MRDHETPRLPGLALLGLLLAATGCASPAPQPAPEPPAYPAAGEPCPQWANLPADRHGNQDSPMLGCSTIMNLRAMAVNPADLDRGRPTTAADGQRAVKAIEDYRTSRARGASGGTGGMTPSIAMPGITGGQ